MSDEERRSRHETKRKRLSVTVSESKHTGKVRGIMRERLRDRERKIKRTSESGIASKDGKSEAVRTGRAGEM